MFKSDDTMLMIASSTQNSPFPGGSKIIEPEGSTRGAPLKGVNFDLAMFKKKFKDNNFFQIETSNDGKILLPRKYILNWLAQKFSTSLYDVYLFYSGHGHENGDWAVETVESPEGDRFSFGDVSQIWRDNRRSEKSHLYIFMDSCYSGCWCVEAGDLNYRLKKQGQLELNISVFAACEVNKRCTSLKGGGGLFSRCILWNEQQLEEQEVKLLYKRQTPFFNNNMEKAARLQPEHIRLLHKSITNAAKIATEPDCVLRGQEEQLNKQNRRREILQQEQKQKVHREREQKLRKQKVNQEQQELKKVIMKIKKVEDWAQLSTRAKLKLEKCGLTKLPDQIGNLTQLTTLSLWSNKLSEVPNTLANLTNLQKLYLGDNQLKEVPECIGKLTNLQKLYLFNNQLKQVPECIGKFTCLQKLDLGGNQLKVVPRWMVKLVKLKELGIYNNQLNVFPLWIGKLQQLERLDMYGNRMMVDVSVVMGLKQLKILWMSKYQLESEQPSLSQKLFNYLGMSEIQQKLQQHCQQRGITLGWY